MRTRSHRLISTAFLMRQSITFTLHEAAMTRFHELAHELQQHGLRIADAYPEMGIITGDVEADRYQQLETQCRPYGVMELARRVQIAPPDAEIQ